MLCRKSVLFVTAILRNSTLAINVATSMEMYSYPISMSIFIRTVAI